MVSYGEDSSLIGSQRKNGNTCRLADAFIDGANENSDADVIHASDYDVQPRIGCNSCFPTEANL